MPVLASGWDGKSLVNSFQGEVCQVFAAACSPNSEMEHCLDRGNFESLYSRRSSSQCFFIVSRQVLSA